MRRWLVLVFAVMLPLQFAWTAASAYCQHESGQRQGEHFGHHAHVHEQQHGDDTSNPGSKLSADPDCASCHAAGSAAISSDAHSRTIPATGSLGAALTVPPIASALARAPDRPQWLRLV